MLRFLDEERMIAYLETNAESNVGLYQHYGFELMENGLIPKSTVSHFAMLRNPVGKDSDVPVFVTSTCSIIKR
jgi:hypothetical protein